MSRDAILKKLYLIPSPDHVTSKFVSAPSIIQCFFLLQILAIPGLAWLCFSLDGFHRHRFSAPPMSHGEVCKTHLGTRNVDYRMKRALLLIGVKACSVVVLRSGHPAVVQVAMWMSFLAHMAATWCPQRLFKSSDLPRTYASDGETCTRSGLNWYEFFLAKHKSHVYVSAPRYWLQQKSGSNLKEELASILGASQDWLIGLT